MKNDKGVICPMLADAKKLTGESGRCHSSTACTHPHTALPALPCIPLTGRNFSLAAAQYTSSPHKLTNNGTLCNQEDLYFAEIGDDSLPRKKIQKLSYCENLFDLKMTIMAWLIRVSMAFNGLQQKMEHLGSKVKPKCARHIKFFNTEKSADPLLIPSWLLSQFKLFELMHIYFRQ